MAKKKPKEDFTDLEVEIDESTFLVIAEEAHRLDITFNEMCRRLIRDFLNHSETHNNVVQKSIPDVKPKKAFAPRKSKKSSNASEESSTKTKVQSKKRVPRK